VGPSCAKLAEELMTKRPHPQQGFRSALGVLRLADEKRYGKARVEKACARALRHRAVGYKSVVAILQHHLEDADETAADKGPLPEHENVRGATVVTSQLEPKAWHAVIGDATLADAILDRLVHNAHRLKLVGDSVRKVDANLTRTKKPAK
jgi:hypothetical protein